MRQRIAVAVAGVLLVGGGAPRLVEAAADVAERLRPHPVRADSRPEHGIPGFALAVV